MSDQSRVESNDQNYDQLRKDLMGRLANKGGLRKGFKSALELDRENKKYKRESREDSVTGLPNERVLDDLLNGLEDAWDRSPRDKKLKGSMIAVDLTGLKKTNDKFGRPAGDGYLIDVSNSLKKNLRPGDRVFRLGKESDEFTLHTPNLMSEEDLISLMDRVDKDLAKKQSEAREKYDDIDYSLSYVAVRYHLAVGPKESFHRGHTEMKQAKKQKEEKFHERGLSIGRVVI